MTAVDVSDDETALYFDEITLKRLLPFSRTDWLRLRRTSYVRGVVLSHGALFIAADDVIAQFPMDKRVARKHPPRPLAVLLLEDRERRAAARRAPARRAPARRR